VRFTFSLSKTHLYNITVTHADSLSLFLKNFTVTVAAIGVSLFKSFGSFILPGKRASASHILVADESLAISLKERLLEGPQSTLLDRFAKEASAYSTCPSKSKGGDLGEFKPGQMVREFDTVVFEAPLMELQGPVKTQFGYHLILVTDRTDPSA